MFDVPKCFSVMLLNMSNTGADDRQNQLLTKMVAAAEMCKALLTVVMMYAGVTLQQEPLLLHFNIAAQVF